MSKRDPAYWRTRVSRNVFNYKGKRVEVRSWSVKIQVLGKRKLITLKSRSLAQAAGEACAIYQTIIEHGWEAISHSRARVEQTDDTAITSGISPASIPYDAEYWKHRLIHRKYPESPGPEAGHELSVRIEHARTGYFFPLGTNDKDKAAKLAMTIYRTVVNKGWDIARESFSREMSLALRWQDNPLAWTYTTIHTRSANTPPTPAPTPNAVTADRNIVFIEPDAGIRRALVECANKQKGFLCEASYDSAAAALRDIPRCKVDLALANLNLTDEAGVACFEELQRILPGLAVLSYSVFADADQLFKSTPGGASVYMLKRTTPDKMFEPISELAGTVTHEQIASCVRNYFHQLSSMLPAVPPFWKLAKLTPRETEILALLAKGDLVKEIAGTLGISNWTVQGHVKNIFEKLNVHSRTEAVVKFLQR